MAQIQPESLTALPCSTEDLEAAFPVCYLRVIENKYPMFFLRFLWVWGAIILYCRSEPWSIMISIVKFKFPSQAKSETGQLCVSYIPNLHMYHTLKYLSGYAPWLKHEFVRGAGGARSRSETQAGHHVCHTRGRKISVFRIFRLTHVRLIHEDIHVYSFIHVNRYFSRKHTYSHIFMYQRVSCISLRQSTTRHQQILLE